MTGNREQLNHWLSIIVPDVMLFPLLYCLENVFAVQMFVSDSWCGVDILISFSSA